MGEYIILWGLIYSFFYVSNYEEIRLIMLKGSSEMLNPVRTNTTYCPHAKVQKNKRKSNGKQNTI